MAKENKEKEPSIETAKACKFIESFSKALSAAYRDGSLGKEAGESVSAALKDNKLSPNWPIQLTESSMAISANAKIGGYADISDYDAIDNAVCISSICGNDDKACKKAIEDSLKEQGIPFSDYKDAVEAAVRCVESVGAASHTSPSEVAKDAKIGDLSIILGIFGGIGGIVAGAIGIFKHDGNRNTSKHVVGIVLGIVWLIAYFAIISYFTKLRLAVV